MPEQAAEQLRDASSFAGPFRAEACARARPRATASQVRTKARPREPFPVQSAPVPRSYVTARGALVAMFALFFFSCLVAGWLSIGALTGLSYATACVLGPYLVRRQALIKVVAAPPALFLVAVIGTQVLTAQGTSRHGKALSVLEGTALTLAATAPWLLAGTALCIGVAIRKGLLTSLRQLRAELRGEPTAESIRSAPARPPGQRQPENQAGSVR